jgi:hypothetical protein
MNLNSHKNSFGKTPPRTQVVGPEAFNDTSGHHLQARAHACASFSLEEGPQFREAYKILFLPYH